MTYTLMLSESMNAAGVPPQPPFSVVPGPHSIMEDLSGRVTIIVDSSSLLVNREYTVELVATSDVSSTQASLTLCKSKIKVLNICSNSST